MFDNLVRSAARKLAIVATGATAIGSRGRRHQLAPLSSILRSTMSSSSPVGWYRLLKPVQRHRPQMFQPPFRANLLQSDASHPGRAPGPGADDCHRRLLWQ